MRERERERERGRVEDEDVSLVSIQLYTAWEGVCVHVCAESTLVR